MRTQSTGSNRLASDFRGRGVDVGNQCKRSLEAIGRCWLVFILNGTFGGDREAVSIGSTESRQWQPSMGDRRTCTGVWPAELGKGRFRQARPSWRNQPLGV